MPRTLTFDIQRFSLHDGPGIRTTVFLKGCPLRCLWCHNPESRSPRAELGFEASKCWHCLACVKACPAGAHTVKGGCHIFERARCEACGRCASACPSGALKLYGHAMDVEAVMAEVLPDRPYYEESGGGLTISGGEPMTHPRFVEQLLRRARAEGINTCLDTSGGVAWSRYERVLPYVDVWHLDYKASPDRSESLVGMSEAKARTTLQRLYAAAPEATVVLRCPMIPGLNDNDAHLENIARLCTQMPRLHLEVLPWHNMGLGKAAALGGTPDPRLPRHNPEPEYRDAIRARIERHRWRLAGAVA